MLIKKILQKKTSWLGVTDNVMEGNFKYADKELPLSWYNWIGQSGPVGNDNGKNCVKIDADSKWHIVKCSLKLTFICEGEYYLMNYLDKIQEIVLIILYEIYCTNENFEIVEKEYPSLEWAGWGSWSSCTKSCGDGIETRKRTIRNPELIYEHQETSYVPFGLECDAEEDRHCNMEPCPGKLFFST